MTRKQCSTCPWKVGASVHAIPGYERAKHEDLAHTIARPGHLPDLTAPVRMMACHYSKEGTELPCVGWVVHQLGAGQNIALRILAARTPEHFDVRTVGPQRECFEETFFDARKGGG